MNTDRTQRLATRVVGFLKEASDPIPEKKDTTTPAAPSPAGAAVEQRITAAGPAPTVSPNPAASLKASPFSPDVEKIRTAALDPNADLNTQLAWQRHLNSAYDNTIDQLDRDRLASTDNLEKQLAERFAYDPTYGVHMDKQTGKMIGANAIARYREAARKQLEDNRKNAELSRLKGLSRYGKYMSDEDVMMSYLRRAQIQSQIEEAKRGGSNFNQQLKSLEEQTALAQAKNKLKMVEQPSNTIARKVARDGLQRFRAAASSRDTWWGKILGLVAGNDPNYFRYTDHLGYTHNVKYPENREDAAALDNMYYKIHPDFKVYANAIASTPYDDDDAIAQQQAQAVGRR